MYLRVYPAVVPAPGSCHLPLDGPAMPVIPGWVVLCEGPGGLYWRIHSGFLTSKTTDG